MSHLWVIDGGQPGKTHHRYMTICIVGEYSDNLRDRIERYCKRNRQLNIVNSAEEAAQLDGQLWVVGAQRYARRAIKQFRTACSTTYVSLIKKFTPAHICGQHHRNSVLIATEDVWLSLLLAIQFDC